MGPLTTKKKDFLFACVEKTKEKIEVWKTKRGRFKPPIFNLFTKKLTTPERQGRSILSFRNVNKNYGDLNPTPLPHNRGTVLENAFQSFF